MNIMDENSNKVEGEEKSASGLWEFVKVLIISVAIVLPIRAYVAQPFIVSGSSMEPNFHDGEYLVIDELSYQFRKPERGEVIVFRFPLNPREFFIKRIIGLPGETIQIENSKIIIDGSLLSEPYLPATFETAPDTKVTLLENQYFVLGDNRGHSSDSRVWGVLERSKMMGRALLRLWPLSRIGIINN